MDNYQKFIHLSRYARWVEGEGRRETWDETVDRYVDFFKSKHGDSLPAVLWEELREAIRDMEVMPSMRALMTAGPALDRDNTAGYNCSYVAVDEVDVLPEIMFILMCGTGVGFSVEREYTNQLPSVPSDIKEDLTKEIVVEDSKEGWATAYRELLSYLYEQGTIPAVDYSQVRPAGERLKTFGGRASGPDPLRKLFQFTTRTIVQAQGRRLRPIELHDVICKIGDVVVCGGVRRSALISLSDLSDEDMAGAKQGEWWLDNPQRALANNSTIYSNSMTQKEFWDEWKSLRESGSGERGIFSRDAASIPTRREFRKFGTNPCSEIVLRSKQFCNLTEIIVRAEDDYADIMSKVRLATVLGTLQASLTDFPFLSDEWKKNSEEEALLGVSMTGICDNEFLCQVSSPARDAALAELRSYAVSVNEMVADRLGINPSASVTCVKPSGTVSQLCNTASGIHARYSDYYIRRVRMDNKDSLCNWLINEGVPHEKDFYGENNVVFSFPVKAPKSVLRNDRTAIEQLELWLSFQRYWCEHKPSVTIYVGEEEWGPVGEWVWEHLSEISGVSFLPREDGSHTYVQAPYEDITKERYEQLVAEMPDVDFSTFKESEDNTTSSQELACKGGACEIV